MVEKSKRKSAYLKRGPHVGGNVACALFAKYRDIDSASAIGNNKKSYPKAALKDHAEQQWWSDPANTEKLRKTAINRKDLEQFEFEVSIDFCSGACQNLFRVARALAPDAKIYIFIGRGDIPLLTYEVDPQSTVVRL